MYKKITTEEAAAFANQLAKVNHMGYATAVIDEHWEADFMFPVSDGRTRAHCASMSGSMTLWASS